MPVDERETLEPFIGELVSIEGPGADGDPLIDLHEYVQTYDSMFADPRFEVGDGD